MRVLVAIVLLALACASVAQAKLSPNFSQRVVEPNDTVELDLGEGTAMFPGPLRIYLVPLHVADSTQGEAHRRPVKIGELGKPGDFGTPRTLRFVVPNVPSGHYAAAVWFKGYATGTWANALEGIPSILTIRNPKAEAGGGARSPGSSAEDGGRRLGLGAAVLPAVLGTGLFAWMWLHRRRGARAGSFAR